MSRPFAVVDCETTGLDDRIHQPWELSIWPESSAAPTTFLLPHSLRFADPQALAINNYFKRDMLPWEAETSAKMQLVDNIIDLLVDVTIIGANPAFDAGMIRGFIGTSVWHHRLTNVSEAARWVFGWDEQRGLADVREHCIELGYHIPMPNHTAEGDVRATRAIFEALRAERAKLVQR